MTFHTFYESDKSNIFSLEYGNYYRSSLSRKDIKHCFEFSILSLKSNRIEIGFTCSYNERTFVSIYQEIQGAIRMINGGSHKYYNCSIRQQEGDTIIVCYDSINNIFIIGKSDNKCYIEIEPFPNPVTWFAYLDHGQDTGNDVSINVGRSQFKNPIPEGYQPWYSGFLSFYQISHSKKNYVIFKVYILVIICKK